MSAKWTLIPLYIALFTLISCDPGNSAASQEHKEDGGRHHSPDVEAFRTVNGPFGTIRALTFSDNGRCLFSGPGLFMPGVPVFPIRKWDVGSMKDVAQLKGHNGSVTCLTVGRNGSLLVSASGDHTVRIWDLIDGREIASLPLATRYDTLCVTDLHLSPDGDTVVIAGGQADGRNITVWNWKRNEVVTLPCEAWINSLSIIDHGDSAVAGGWFGPRAARQAFLAAIELSTGRVLHRFETQARSVSAVAVSPDGTRLLAGGSDGFLEYYAYHPGQARLLRRFAGHSGEFAGIAFVNSPRHALSVGGDGRIVSWNLESGGSQWSLNTGQRIASMALCVEQDLVAVGGYDGWISIWNLKEVEEQLTSLRRSTSSPESCSAESRTAAETTDVTEER